MRLLTSSMSCWRIVGLVPLLALGSWCVAAPAVAASKPDTSAPIASASAFTCPLSASLAATKVAMLAVADDKSCLIAAKAVGHSEEVFDLRDRAEFIDFHLPGAQSATVGSLSTMPRVGEKRVVVYDSGRFRSDALLLCDRLRSAGVRQVKVVDGGIAAWAQVHARPQTLTLNRLSDADVPAALSEVSGGAVVLAESLRPALRQFGIKSSSTAAARPTRVVLLADAQTPLATIQAQLAKSTTAFYWVGTADRLQALLGAHLAQDRKRTAGPAQPQACGAL